jgi:hypothetical protein
MPTLKHPYLDLAGGAWLRGNLHTHSTQSDGKVEPQQVIDSYAARGYDFLMLSDHDIYTGPEKYAHWDARGMVLIPGNEVSAAGPHLLHVNAERRVNPDPDRQVVINDILTTARQQDAFVVINHPDWQKAFNHCTIEQLRQWTGYIGLEIYNGVISVLDGSPYGTNKWDMLLSDGRQVWGFAHDDFHKPEHIALGWNVAYVRQRSVAGVIEALRNGRFYASTGVRIRKIQVEGTRVWIETDNARRIAAIRDVGRRIKSVDDSWIEFEIPDNVRYVRFQCWGEGEQMAWTQPFFVEADNPQPSA